MSTQSDRAQAQLRLTDMRVTRKFAPPQPRRRVRVIIPSKEEMDHYLWWRSRRIKDRW